MYHCLTNALSFENFKEMKLYVCNLLKSTCIQYFLHIEKNGFFCAEKNLLTQLVFSSFPKDGQLGSAQLGNFSARLGSARLVKIQLELTTRKKALGFSYYIN